ncbi:MULTISPECIES: histidine phosphatase family protein [Streptomyces]|uniref:Histidine phosphatase family protein n=2 Tax=Streptomyces TaxID=1883 RepID=A0ABU2RSJ8_9ACTN|nr:MULTISPECIES: histidine phosphatase family protein [unclassified Streptomyces]MBK3591004.1 MSMEG_4193 family putative phosphomutase [Streptomyces sp. MBT51]MDT0431537.1 histidine phosphatase family protein [Streptomyces sp. DSM 41770]
MPTLILVRHGRSTANTSGVLAGRTPGVALDERGASQAAALPGRLAGVPLVAAVSSPLQRCRETLGPLLDARPGLPLHTEDRISECDYGDWSGRKLAELSDEPLMSVVQQHPSSAAFPGGESMRAMQARAVDAVREWNARVEEEHGDDAVYVMCSHGDIIKALVADALGMHLDLFQRIHADPCSVTAIRYTRLRPFLLRLGDTGDLGSLAPREVALGADADGDAATDTASDAAVGGGAGAP